MFSQRSERAWIPAAVASVALAVGLWGARELDKGFLGGDLFFGPEPFSSDGRALPGTLAAIVAILLIGSVGTWWALRGLRPGSALLPAFLSTWMVLVLACVVAALVRSAVVADSAGLAARLSNSAAFTSGARAGLGLGWIAALIGLAAWLVVRPGADASPDPLPIEQDDADRPREPVMKRRADVNHEPSLEPDLSPRPDDEQTPPTYVGRRSSGRYAEDDPSPEPQHGGQHRG